MRRFRDVCGRYIAAAALFGVTALIIPSHPNADELGADRSGTIRKMLPAVVSISVKKFEVVSPTTPAKGTTNVLADPGSSIKYYVGSGFVIDPSGLILTNYHVVEDAFEISIGLSDGTILQGKTQHASRVADLAIVKVEAGHPLVATHWGDSDALQVGDQVFVAGNPFGVGLSVSGGIVSALNRDLQDTAYDDYIQTDAAINHGNSGGPLVDLHGDVVGVNSELISPTQGFVGLGFSIPARTARFVVEQLQTYGWDHPAWVGLKVQRMTQQLANAEGVDQATGSIVSWVFPDSPASKAGLQIGDIIVGFDNGTPTDDRALLRDIARTPAGTSVHLAVRRNGVEQSITMVTDVWPRSQWEARDAPLAIQEPKITVPPNLGLALSVIDSAARPKLGLQGDLAGVLVDSVDANTDASRQGLMAGDIILRVRDKPVAAPADVMSGIEAARNQKRDYLQLLVLPKVRTVPGPRWYALQVAATGG
jgi:serine protease Do